MADNQEKIILEVDEQDYLAETKEKIASVRVLAFSLGKENYCINCWCSRYWYNQELSELVS